MSSPAPLISVVIPTYNRAGLLKSSLESLTTQTLEKAAFEVVVVSDGSTDDTDQVCRELSSRLTLRYFRIRNSGISAAKNLGIFVSSARIILFFDDDDEADTMLLEQHLETHRRHPEEFVAVLGYTDWSSKIDTTPFMRYIVGSGNCLFSYGALIDGESLDFRYFWGGRSSCKRSFLTTHEIFNQNFGSIIEDVELGYRLSKHGLRVIYNRSAISHMTRSIDLETFCARSSRQGEALVRFSQLHAESQVMDYCHLPYPINCEIWEAAKLWPKVAPDVEARLKRILEIEERLPSGLSPLTHDELLTELHRHYWWLINAYKLKGAADSIGTPSLRHAGLKDAVEIDYGLGRVQRGIARAAGLKPGRILRTMRSRVSLRKVLKPVLPPVVQRWVRNARLSARLERSGLFDPSWYRQTYPDSAASGLSPFQHFVRVGVWEGREPCALFDGRWYLSMNSDVEEAGFTAAEHYLCMGAAEGRFPHPMFDTRYYLNNNPDVKLTNLNPLGHYLRVGWREGRNPNPLFDVRWYLKEYEDVQAEGCEPLSHFVERGLLQGLSPSEGLTAEVLRQALAQGKVSRHTEAYLRPYFQGSPSSDPSAAAELSVPPDRRLESSNHGASKADWGRTGSRGQAPITVDERI